MNIQFSFRIVTIAALLAFVVVMLGAYTRLTHAGLGCPDWPGCYAQYTAPSSAQAISQAEQAFPGMVIESRKAWTEMVHRYLAGSLGVFILLIAISAAWQRRQWAHPILLPTVLLGLVIFQAALGRWTVTWKLLPLVVMGHLLGGLLIFASLVCLRLMLSRHHQVSTAILRNYRPWVLLGAIILFLQIALGGWVSANYAGIACIGFPACNGQWLPSLNFNDAFNLLSPIGQSYQGGVLDMTARVTIQFVHRLGAIVTFLYLLLLSFALIKQNKILGVRAIAASVLVLVCLQFILGIINVTKLLPLSNAVAHNGVAALLLAVMVSLTYAVWAKEPR